MKGDSGPWEFICPSCFDRNLSVRNVSSKRLTTLFSLRSKGPHSPTDLARSPVTPVSCSVSASPTLRPSGSHTLNLTQPPMSPSPLLPQYSKTALLDADEDLGEGDRLLPSTSSTYPPPAAATAGGADEVVPPPPPAGYVLPPHLANYMLQGRLFLWPNKTAVCSREASRAVRRSLRSLIWTRQSELELTPLFLLPLPSFFRSHDRKPCPP